MCPSLCAFAITCVAKTTEDANNGGECGGFYYCIRCETKTEDTSSTDTSETTDIDTSDTSTDTDTTDDSGDDMAGGACEYDDYLGKCTVEEDYVTFTGNIQDEDVFGRKHSEWLFCR